jgi:hypothetical protein
MNPCDRTLFIPPNSAEAFQEGGPREMGTIAMSRTRRGSMRSAIRLVSFAHRQAGTRSPRLGGLLDTDGTDECAEFANRALGGTR